LVVSESQDGTQLGEAVQLWLLLVIVWCEQRLLGSSTCPAMLGGNAHQTSYAAALQAL
jgi:hypothetical protein